MIYINKNKINELEKYGFVRIDEEDKFYLLEKGMLNGCNILITIFCLNNNWYGNVSSGNSKVVKALYEMTKDEVIVGADNGSNYLKMQKDKNYEK